MPTQRHTSGPRRHVEYVSAWNQDPRREWRTLHCSFDDLADRLNDMPEWELVHIDLIPGDFPKIRVYALLKRDVIKQQQ